MKFRLSPASLFRALLVLAFALLVGRSVSKLMTPLPTSAAGPFCHTGCLTDDDCANNDANCYFCRIENNPPLQGVCQDVQVLK